MASSQSDATHEILHAVSDFLGGPTPDGDRWCLELGEHLRNDWGAVYGGALAAGMLAVARAATPDRSPRSIHVQTVRSVPIGRAFATVAVRHPGRTVGTVQIDLFDDRNQLCVIALLTMVAPEAVATNYDLVTAAPPLHLIEVPADETRLIPSGGPAEIVSAINLNARGRERDVFVMANNVRSSVDGSMSRVTECTVPWGNLELTGPEAACLIGDASVALPIALSYVALEDIGPNPDITLRFTTAPATRVIVAASTLLSVQRGTATTGIEVQAGNNQLAHGLATSLLLRAEASDATRSPPPQQS